MNLDKIKEWMALAQQCGDAEFWNSMTESTSSGEFPLMSAKKAVWSPAVDLFLTADEMILWAELPGVRKEDLNVSVTRDTLILRGFKKSALNGPHLCLSERYFGSFERTVRLPHPVEADMVAARLEDGLLVVRLKTSRTSEATITVE